MDRLGDRIRIDNDVIKLLGQAVGVGYLPTGHVEHKEFWRPKPALQVAQVVLPLQVAQLSRQSKKLLRKSEKEC